MLFSSYCRKKKWSYLTDAASNMMLKLHLEQEYKQAGWNIIASLFCGFQHWLDWQMHTLLMRRSRSLLSILSTKALELACNQLKFHKQHRHSEMQDRHVIYNRYLLHGDGLFWCLKPLSTFNHEVLCKFWFPAYYIPSEMWCTNKL